MPWEGLNDMLLERKIQICNDQDKLRWASKPIGMVTIKEAYFVLPEHKDVDKDPIWRSHEDLFAP